MKPVAALILLLVVVLPATPAAAAAERPSHLQVVAHPDDDMLFMAPDLGLSIRSGARVTTVFITAGESDVEPAADYAADRQAGARAAFAAMARAPDRWDRSVLELPGGHVAELHQLRARPRVSLVFLGLPDDNDANATGGEHALIRLWRDPSERVRTVPAAGSGIPVRAHDRGSLLSALRRLRAVFEPDLVRTQDPRPDPRYQQQWQRFQDHPDHVITARLVAEAMPDALVAHYRQYNTADTPPNLPARVLADKRSAFAAYTEHDPRVGLGEPYASWLARMRQRRPLGARWIGDRGRYAYVRGDRLISGDRTGESTVDTPFAPRAGSAVFAGSTLLVQQRRTGAVFGRAPGGEWHRIGAPPPRAPGVEISRPAAVEVAGRLVLAVRDRGGGASVHDGRGWCRLGGSGVESVSALVTASGQVHVLATTAAGGMLRWRLSGSCGRRVAVPDGIRPAGAIATTSGEHAQAAFRDERGDLVVLAERSGWRPVLRREAEALSDPALAVDAAGRPLLAVRNGAGRLEVLSATGSRTGPRIQGGPALDPSGSLVAALDDRGAPVLWSVGDEGAPVSRG
ncbi:PIG-L family deacetylase [Saccharopolyspora griseoalba]|uniref:PIG-L family deacetylase n=1 Tax=Saccharopolyspora griseoalba TaxID=1431848 RepID=A0ABW2LPR3_9PSEU